MVASWHPIGATLEGRSGWFSYDPALGSYQKEVGSEFLLPRYSIAGIGIIFVCKAIFKEDNRDRVSVYVCVCV